jgi:predicted alpha/beta-fold hydrolase
MLIRTEHWKFRPHPLLRNGHLQTVAAVYLPWKHAPYGAKVHFVAVDDVPPEQGGDQIALHEDCPPGWTADKPVVLMVHGLAGCYRSEYMGRMTARLTQRDYCVFRMDMRGCGAGEGIARLPTHCGRSGDVVAAVRFIAELYPESPVYVIGFSLGGCLTLNMLAEAGETPVGNVKRSLAICPPVDLFAVERRFDSPGGRPYDKFFCKKLWKQITDRWRRFPEAAPTVMPRQPRRLRQLDELVTAPTGGFLSADDYYAKTQPGPKLHRISQPVLIVAANDDPVVPTTPLFEYEHGPGVQTAVVPGGGHLGFIARANGDPDNRWLDWRIIEWIETGR